MNLFRAALLAVMLLCIWAEHLTCPNSGAGDLSLQTDGSFICVCCSAP